jgi:aminoglycoside phosphotransferase (APT) family kinase protein
VSEPRTNTIPNGPEASRAYEIATEGRARSLEDLRPDLEQWLAARLDVAEVTLTGMQHPTGAGTSSETILATASWDGDNERVERDIVFRVHPDRFQLFREPHFFTQFELLTVLHETDAVRVPEPLFAERDPSVIGLPFYAMARVHGNVPVTSPPYNAAGFLFDATPAQRRVAWTSAMEELCRIARVSTASVELLLRPPFGATGIEQELEDWRRSIDWSTGNQTPDVFWRLYEWLENHRPAVANGLAWGDARMGNMVFDADFRLAGVLDWEQAHLGGPRHDLGWWLWFDEFHSVGRNLKRLDGLGTREETIALWEELVGEPAGDLRWYEVATGFKVALLSSRSFILMGATDPKVFLGAPLLPMTCDLAGIDLRA